MGRFLPAAAGPPPAEATADQVGLRFTMTPEHTQPDVESADGDEIELEPSDPAGRILPARPSRGP